MEDVGGEIKVNLPEELQNEIDPQKISYLKDKVVLVKYGGNAMTNETAKDQVIEDLRSLSNMGCKPVVVHGGGPFIKKMLKDAGIKSDFASGHRITTEKAMHYVEVALKGEVNSDITGRLIANGLKAVGVSGKDGKTVSASKRRHYEKNGGEEREVDLGQVGDVRSIDPRLIHLLIRENYIPVIAPVAIGEDNKPYNINADMFAGHMAGALKAASYVALTDVNGLREDPEDPGSFIAETDAGTARDMIGKSVVGGMIPKIESALIALEQGVKDAHIINGTEKYTLLKQLITRKPTGTRIK